MQVPAQLEETIEDRVHAEEFEFTELQFIKSSRMSKRHLIFACRIRVSFPAAVWPDLWPLCVLQAQPLYDTVPRGIYTAELVLTESWGVASPQLQSCCWHLFCSICSILIILHALLPTTSSHEWGGLMPKSIVCQDDMVYALYTLPTVILSRRTDQYEKAWKVLNDKASASQGRRAAPRISQGLGSAPTPPVSGQVGSTRPLWDREAWLLRQACWQRSDLWALQA